MIAKGNVLIGVRLRDVDVEASGLEVFAASGS